MNPAKTVPDSPGSLSPPYALPGAHRPSKLIRRLTSPVELLFDVTRHWFVLLFCVSAGTLIAYAVFSGQPPVFEATATLVLNPRGLVMDSDGRAAPDREAGLNFIGEQINLLNSDSVLQKVVDAVGAKRLLDQLRRVEDDMPPPPLERAYRDAADWLTFFLNGQPARSEVLPPEVLAHQAKATFRQRTLVLNERRSNIVKIGVLGTRRLALKDELHAWIDGYRLRIDEISKETYQAFFEERMKFWSDEENKAKEALDKFRKDQPDVSKERLDLKRENIVRLKLALEQLKNAQMGMPAVTPLALPPAAGLPAGGDMLTQLKRRRDALELERAQLLAKHPPTSAKVKTLDAEMEVLSGEIAKIEDPSIVADGKLPAEEALARRISAYEDALTQAYGEMNVLDGQVGELTALIDAVKRASERRSSFLAMRERRVDQTESSKIVSIQVQDKPAASLVPLKRRLGVKVGAGAVGGMALGVLLCFGLEFFSQKIRFRRDVEEELGLRVVAVVPEH